MRLYDGGRLLLLLVVLDYEPELLFGLAEHSREVHLVAMIEPVSILLANNFRKGSLVVNLGGLLLQGLLQGSNGDLRPAFIIFNELLLTNDTPGTRVIELLRLQLLALEVEEAEGIFLPRIGLDHQPTYTSIYKLLE